MTWENFEMRPCEGLRVSGKASGKGDRLLLMIPGFGNDRHWFDALFTSIPEGWILAAVDLPPFHGSKWTLERPIGQDELRAWVRAVLDYFKVSEVHVLAFSLGARTALGMYLSAPDKVRSLLLISPDGLRVNPMYAFAMYTRLGHFLFKRIIHHPARFLRIVRILRGLRILNDSIFRLTMEQLESESRRQRLYHSWHAWSGTRPTLDQLTQATGIHGTRWDLVWGREDEILSPRLGRKFCRKIPQANLHLVNGGHFLLKSPTEPFRSTIWKILSRNEHN